MVHSIHQTRFVFISGFTKLYMVFGGPSEKKCQSSLIIYCKIPILCQSLAKYAQILLVMSDRTDTFQLITLNIWRECLAYTINCCLFYFFTLKKNPDSLKYDVPSWKPKNFTTHYWTFIVSLWKKKSYIFLYHFYISLVEVCVQLDQTLPLFMYFKSQKKFIFIYFAWKYRSIDIYFLGKTVLFPHYI
jgi:hypothetical protein